MGNPQFNIAIITVSDRASEGVYDDLSGPAARDLLTELLTEHEPVFTLQIVPDNPELLTGALTTCIEAQCDFIFTTGGTGIGPRDITPEATRFVLDKEIPGIAEAIREFSLTKTKSAMLSRGIAGLTGQSIIINLPGSPRAVKEIINFLAPTLKHSYFMVRGIDVHK
ncbi:MogA/MoaB family molybdenum cofactor biosynthesis protein [Candidatus Margulisiibacteriota bacterium]